MATSRRSNFGELLKSWRGARKHSQLDLALQAGISARHLSCIETGRAQPSREMVLLLGQVLELPLRDQNALLQAAGFAALYQCSDLDAAELAPIRRSIDFLLERHSPFPAVLLDRGWTVRMHNRSAMLVLGRFVVDPALLAPPLNAMRLLFDPGGARSFITNWTEVAANLVERLHREAVGTSPDDPVRSLLEERLESADLPADWRAPTIAAEPQFLMPLRLQREDLELTLYSAITTLGTPQDVTLQELRLETFFPADEASEKTLRALVAED